jgi:secreted trypsin-like serine protease
MKIILNLVLAINLFTNLSLIGGTIDPHVPDEKYINFGKDFPYIHKLCGQYEDNTLFCASCVSIDSHWALTAAHVVQNSKLCILGEGEKTFLVKQVFIHEEFNNDKFGFSDIALCYIENDLGLKFYPQLYEDNDELDKTCTISGYGATGTFSTGWNNVDNKKRAGSNKVDIIDRDLLVCSPSISNKTSLEFLIANGDSGGGLFIGNKIAGINSCVLAKDKVPNSNYGDEGGHTRVSKYVEWIKSVIARKKNEQELQKYAK